MSILPEAWKDMSCLRELGNMLFIIGKVNKWARFRGFKLWERIGLFVEAGVDHCDPMRGHALSRSQFRLQEPWIYAEHHATVC